MTGWRRFWSWTSLLCVKLAQSLQERLEQKDSGLCLLRIDNQFQMASKPEYGDIIRKVMDMRRNVPLSPAAMEVLSIVAYNQPVTKAFIEQIRGVDCFGVLQSLTVKELVEEKGRLELPGRPLLYGTTDNFLRCFQLSSLEELPPLPEKEKAQEPSEEGEQEEELKDLDGALDYPGDFRFFVSFAALSHYADCRVI